MQLINLVKASRVIESLQYEVVDVSLAYKIMKFLKAVNDDISFYDKKAKEIVDKFALRDDEGKPITNGGNIQLDNSRQDEFEKEVFELNTTEVDSPDIKFNLEEFNGLKISALRLMALEDFIIKEE